MRLTQIIEALLFASETPLSAADLSKVDERLDEDTVEAVIHELRAEYELSERSFQIYEVAGGFQLLTRPEFVAVLDRYDSVPQPSRLSVPALEVLSIIAYRQPLGRAEIEDIRGVGSSGVLRTLVERDLVAPVGRSEGLGRPLLYGTTRKFLEHFGFRSLEDLPRPDELPVVLRERPAAEPDGDVAAEGGVPADAPVAAEGGAQAGSDVPEMSAPPDADPSVPDGPAGQGADAAGSAAGAPDALEASHSAQQPDTDVQASPEAQPAGEAADGPGPDPDEEVAREAGEEAMPLATDGEVGLLADDADALTLVENASGEGRQEQARGG
jgi:segregation and condensation protein B